MKKSWLLLSLVFVGVASLPATAQFKSKEALRERLYERGFDYVVELPNKNRKPGLVGNTGPIRKNVIDLKTGKKLKSFEERLPAFDYIYQPETLRHWLTGGVVMKAYNVSDVMICYYVDDIGLDGQEKCLLFPHSVRDVVKAIQATK